MNTKIEIGKRNASCDNGFRVIGNDTSSGRPWSWYCPTLEQAELLARTICEQTGEDVEICKYVGVVRRPAPPTELVYAADYELPKISK